MRGRESSEARIAKARRGTVGGHNDAHIQRAASRYLDRYVGPLKADFLTVKERLEKLDGIRGASGDRAIRMTDFRVAKGITLEASLVSSSPTADEHNALVRDLRKIRDALNNVG